MSEKAQALGSSPKLIASALRFLTRIRALTRSFSGIPRATRIALIYANKCDRHFAAKKLTPQDLVKLEEIAHSFFIDQLRKWKAL